MPYLLSCTQYIPRYDCRYTQNNGEFKCISNDYQKLIDINSYLQLDFLSKLSLGDHSHEQREIKWNLSDKYGYEFLIDVYLSNQGGLEESIFLSDLEDGRLFRFYKELQKPYFNFSIKEVKDLENKMLDIIYYNDNIILDYTEFLTIFNDPQCMHETIEDYLDSKKFNFESIYMK